MSDTQNKQSWTEAVIECVSDSAERERLIRMYDYDELVKACLALGTLALTAKTESAKNAQLQRELAAAERKLAEIVILCEPFNVKPRSMSGETACALGKRILAIARGEK